MLGKSKRYEALGPYLKARSHQSTVPMSFEEIEALVGELPASKQYPAWWSNNPSNNPLTKVWLDAGFRTEQVDIAGRKLIFRNHEKIMRDFASIEVPTEIAKSMPGGIAEDARDFRHGENMPKARHPLIGSLKGLLWIEPGYDLTKPAMDDDWEEAFDKKWDALLK